ncbi:hypothetical protein [Gordonia soli]|uniref:Uncharacterized protein n=1 Tax=Gordonia soli NBRC 108243 TaxID=1223545 RepID=M0QM42_9ACTN|nr:hypothetical protein [Gordonia soli]GAC68462.1 hypothetical protein GS4_15_01120 [Gordonia soli NBRC 108243]
MTDADTLRDQFRRFLWPGLFVGGLLLVGFSLAPWGTSDQGVRPSVSGVGRVSVPGASAEDVAFLEQHTQRPGLVVIGAAVLILIAAADGWWRPQAFWYASAIVGIPAVGVLIWSIVTVASPEQRLFDDQVIDALDGPSSILAPGYGVVGTAVVSAVMIVGVLGAIALRVRADRVSRTGGSS